MFDLLQGFRIIEGSAFVAAPLGGMTLAQMGADVIRFDALDGGLDYHRWPITKDGRSLYWAGLNKGKRSIRVDLRSAAGRELIHGLLRQPGAGGGILLTNFPARGWLDYETLKAQTRPDLVMVNILGNSDGGSAVDYTINCAMGLPYVTGPASEQAPVNHVLPAWDALTGLAAALAVLAAVRCREHSGAGQLVRVSLADVALWMLGNLGHISEVQINDVDRKASGNDLFGAFGRDFPTKDGRRVMLVAITRQQWKAVAAASGMDGEFRDLEKRLNVDLEQEGDRYRARAEIAALLEPWIANQTLAELAARLSAAGVCWGPYQSFRELVETDPRCSENNPLFRNLEQPGIGSYLVPGLPISFGALDRKPPRRAPALGEHTDEVLREVLELDEATIRGLHTSSIVAGPGNEP
jgi:2-methylfumaryl-CoA isomerase